MGFRLPTAQATDQEAIRNSLPMTPCIPTPCRATAFRSVGKGLSSMNPRGENQLAELSEDPWFHTGHTPGWWEIDHLYIFCNKIDWRRAFSNLSGVKFQLCVHIQYIFAIEHWAGLWYRIFAISERLWFDSGSVPPKNIY